MIRMKSSDASVSSYDFVDNNGRGIFAISNHNLRFGCNDIEQYRIQPLGIFTWYDGAGGTRMTLNSTGLGVGLNPSSYAGRLVVGGTPAATSGAIVYVRDTFANGSNNSLGSIMFASSPGFDFYVGKKVSSGVSWFSIGNANSGAEYFQIDSSGNVGVGVTPSATDSTYYQALEIGRVGQGFTAAKNALTGSPSSWLSNNSYATYSSGVVWNYAISQPAAQYRLFEGQHQWFNAPSGTAGNAITFTQAMTLDASGNLLVGKAALSDTTVGWYVRPNGITTATMSSSVNTDTSYQLYSTGASAYRFYVGMGGTVYATNTTISAISDARLKENVQDIDVGLDAILALKPRKFDWKTGKGKNIKGDRGFIAQEFETVFPNLIDEWKDPAPEGEAPYKSVRQDLIPVLVKAIQELTARVEALEA
jgi:hypothetical protein